MSNRINPITLGEGNTPLIRLWNIEKKLNWEGELWAKAEYQNPTGSFKDRGSVFEIITAVKQKKKGVVCASTGNMAVSLSAYAARANVTCCVVVPTNTPANKLKQTIINGACIVKVKGGYDDCVKRAEDIAQKKQYFLCGDYIVRREGQRSLGRELAESGINFEAFIAPVGNGTIGCAVIEGFIERGQTPRFIGVQGKGADPLVSSFNTVTDVVIPINNPKTVASAMKVGRPLDGELTLRLINKTNGTLLSVTDEDILRAQKQLANQEGIFVETSAAATLAALIKIGCKFAKLKIVLILTGNGLKE